MKITNKYGLPKAFENFFNETMYTPKEKRYSATTLLKPTQQIILEKRYNNELEQDVSEMVWLLFGTAVHDMLEKYDETGNAELYFNTPIIEDYLLSGKVDLYDEENGVLTDYKTASVNKVLFKNFDDWYKQGMIYAYLLKMNGKDVKKVQFHALLKDWSQATLKRKVMNREEYPKTAIFTYDFMVSDKEMNDIEVFIKEKFDELVANESFDDGNLTECSNEEKWNSGDTYAVKKRGVKKAKRVFKNEQDAIEFLTKGHYIEQRKGVNKKCDLYCPVRDYCKQYKREKVK
jgi:hypothetical protein